MAEREVSDYFSYPYADRDPYREGVGISDYGRALGSGAAGIGELIGSGLRAIGETRQSDDDNALLATEYLGRAFQTLFSDIREQTESGFSPAAARAIQATITDPNFWSLSAIALKATRMTPELAASVVPAILMPGAIAATATVAATGGAISAASVVDELYQMTDELSDAELQEQVPAYRARRESGMDEETARREYNQELRGLKPLLTGLIGAVANTVGPAGMAARGLRGEGASITSETGEGLGRAALKGTGEGAGSELVEGGAEATVVEQGRVDMGLQDDINYRAIAEQAGEGAVLGGLFGGAFGAAGRRRAPETTDPLVAEALGANPPAPAPSVPASNTQAPNQPTNAAPAPGPQMTPAAGATPPVTTEVTQPAAVAANQVPVNTPAEAAAPVSAQPSAPVVVDGPVNPEQAAALAATGPKAPSTVAPPPVEAPAPQVLASTPVDQATPTTPQSAPQAGVATPPVPDTAPTTPQSAPQAGVGTPPVPDTAPAPSAQPAPLPVEPSPTPQAQSGPRILEARDGPDYTGQWNRRVDTQIAGAEQATMPPPENEPVDGGRNRDENERIERQATREHALASIAKFKPREEENGIFSTKPAEIVAARKLIMDRAKAIYNEAVAAGIKIPKSFRDNKDKSENYNAETIVLMEARRLATKDPKKLTKSDFRRFKEQEVGVVLGRDEVAAARRAEGDAAMKRGVAKGEDSEGAIDAALSKSEAGVVADALTNEADPETILAAKEEARAEDDDVEGEYSLKPEQRRALDKEIEARENESKMEQEKFARLEKKIPERIRNVMDNAMVAGAAKPPKVVERVKRRAINKPAPAKPLSPAETVTTKVTKPSKPAVANKVAEMKAKVAAAREATNPNPTPAQAEAGNYKKGSVSIHGMTLRIETPKGAMRRGIDDDGRPWNVEMANDYGYIEGTKGADGEPLDVYIGPDHDAEFIYVVDQVDPQTREFDEHKVLMGFKSEARAWRAYERGFSDGSGLSRMGDAGLRKMTVAEFKEWSKDTQTERAGATAAEVAEAQFMVADDIAQYFGIDQTDTPDGIITDPITGERAEVLTTQNASDIIGQLSTGNLTGLDRVMAGVTMRALREHVGNVDVHFVLPNDIVRLSGYKGDGMPLGYYSYRGDKNIVVVRADLLARPDKLRHVVLHELTHAATSKAIEQKPEIEEAIADMMYRTRVYLDRNPELQQKHYAFTNEKEFVAEAFSNPDFQRLLAGMQLDPVVARSYRGLGPYATMWQAFVLMVRRALDLPTNTMTMLEAAIRVTGDAMVAQRDRSDAEGTVFLTDGNIKPLTKRVTTVVTDMLNRPELQPSNGRPWLYTLRTMDSLSRGADKLFGGAANNPFRRLAQLMEERRVRASKHYERATPLLRNSVELQQRWDKVRGEDGESVWQNFTALTMDETMMGVYADRPLADQKHIRKNSTRDAQKRAAHPELARRYAALPDELKAHRAELLDYFKNEQRALSHSLFKNRILKLVDMPDADRDALATRLLDRTETDADKTLLGDFYDTIKAAGILSKIDGPYFPLMRRGNWVVVARSPITPPAGATVLPSGEFEFTTESAAEKFMTGQKGRAEFRTVYVDKITGSEWGTEDGKRVRITSQDINAVARYRVSVQDRHVEMFDNRNDARAAAAALSEKGFQVDDVVPRNFDLYGAQAEALSPQIQRMVSNLERRADARAFSTEQKQEMLQAVTELSMQMMGSTRIQSRSLPRKNVAGASRDLTRNLHDYAIAMGNHLSKVETGPLMDAEIQSVKDYIDTHRNDGMNGARQELYNETMRRITMKDPRTEGGFGSVVNRVLAVSFIDKLMSPSYSVINATQPMMITAPYLAAHYGVGRAYGAMGRAYNDIGSLATIRAGAAATAQKLRNGQAVPTDPVSMIIGRLTNPRERQMLEFMVQKGALDTDAGLEVSTIMRERRGLLGKLDGGVGYLEGIARQMPKAVEAVNRSVSALAAYRLEMERSGDHTTAVQFAYDTVNRTQFNYSHSNAAPFMNNPLLRIATQFKKYGIGMYQFLGEQAGIAISATSTPQERVAAIKALSMTVGMHVLIAGAMGLPTEPIKLLVTGANAMGITDWTWADVEAGQREALAGLFGKDVGEALSRGIPRLVGVDLSSRMGIDTLMGPFGEPRSNEAQDLKAYLWDALAGAPAGLIFDMTGGVGSMLEGDVMRGMEKLVPIKVFSDSLKAYRQMTEGTISQNTGRKIMSEFSLGEATLRAIGFAPAREAEAYERSNMFYRARDHQNTVRTDFLKGYSDASGAARGRIWQDIQKWNKTQPKEVRISLSDLRKYKRRLEQDMKNTREGLRARKREEHLLDRADRTFNFEP